MKNLGLGIKKALALKTKKETDLDKEEVGGSGFRVMTLFFGEEDSACGAVVFVFRDDRFRFQVEYDRLGMKEVPALEMKTLDLGMKTPTVG